jgi:rRNA processing protein Krr1/Pno1
LPGTQSKRPKWQKYPQAIAILKDSVICDVTDVQKLLDDSDALVKILTSIGKRGNEAQKQLKTQN